MFGVVSTQFVEIVGSCWIFVVAIVFVFGGEDLVRTAVQGTFLPLGTLPHFSFFALPAGKRFDCKYLHLVRDRPG